MSRFKREHSAGATLTTTTFFSFSSLFVAFFFVRARTRGATIVVYAFFFAFLFDFCYLLGVSLSFKSHFACIETTPPPMTTRYYYGTRRQRRKRRNDEKEPTDEKASSSKNRSLRARTRYINTNICIYIFLLLRNQPTEQRAFESSRIRAKYPDRIPVIVEKSPKSDVPELDKKKYLVPSDLTVGQFVYVIRKRVKLSAEKAIFVFVNNALPPTASLMSTIYEENKDEDGFLYIQYSGENTFGRRCLDDDLKA